MKLNKTLLTALAAVALSASSAMAVTYTDGDLILGFRATGGQGNTIDYEVNLGQDINFAAGGSFATGIPFALSLGNIAADLVDIYGSNWYSRTDLFFGVAGTQKTGGNGFAQNTLFATQAQPALPLTRRSTSNSSGAAVLITSMGLQYGLGTSPNFDGTVSGDDQMASTNSSVALIQSVAINQNSYANNQPGGTNSNATQAFKTFTGGIEGNPTATLDLYQLAPGTGAGTLDGTINLSSNGTVTFTSVAAVPEPSTYALMGLGGAGLAVAAVRRRKNNAAINA